MGSNTCRSLGTTEMGASGDRGFGFCWNAIGTTLSGSKGRHGPRCGMRKEETSHAVTRTAGKMGRTAALAGLSVALSMNCISGAMYVDADMTLKCGGADEGREETDVR